jgi:hypothetical protein
MQSVDAGAHAKSEQEAPTLVGASSSGTASLEGGNSCYAMFHCQELIRRTGAASGTPIGTGTGHPILQIRSLGLDRWRLRFRRQ